MNDEPLPTAPAMPENPPGMPIWAAAATAAADAFPQLDADLSVDVVIIGGGITGITTAAQLVRAGRTVAVLEAQEICSGNSSQSTGNLYGPVAVGLYDLGKKWGDDVVEQVVRSRLLAIDLIERNIVEHDLHCDFTREPWTLYTIAGFPDEVAQIEHEYQAARGAGLDAKLSNDLPLPYMIRRALVVRNQAQFNPFLYVRGLAAAIQSAQCRICEHSAVVDIDIDAGIVRTIGYAVRADHIVMATHTPKGFNVLQTELGPYREYAVAIPMGAKELPSGIFWSAGEDKTSTRLAEIGGKPYVLMIGEKHKTGQEAHPETCYRKLEQYLQSRFDARFDASAQVFRWSAQQYRSADGLPYIGSSGTASSLYLATGFGPDGLTYGSLAGWMIADEICGRKNPYTELYSPRRFTPVKSARNFLKENLNVAGRYIKDYTQSADAMALSGMPPGEGGLVEIDGQRVAAYRDDAGRLHALSPVCTHLKCIVHWNRAERSWDCPCHGSRFRYDGSVIEGPALHPLKPFGQEPEQPDVDLSMPPPV
ncbi:MAG TPA: FAD-dependent oxidoreductase [Paucimonas sp.]|nr:FAD-dependent oxidoreductase [Paucimonas sp.]